MQYIDFIEFLWVSATSEMSNFRTDLVILFAVLKIADS